MIVAALAAVVAVVATTVAWRAGRRARRAADLVSQLLDPPVVEARRGGGSRRRTRGRVGRGRDDRRARSLTGDLAAEPTMAPAAPFEAGDPDVPHHVTTEEPAAGPSDLPTDFADLPPDLVFAPARPLAARPGPDAHTPTPGADRTDPAPGRIPVLDLDRLRSWLTLGDVNLGRLAVVSVELDNLAFVQERLGYAAGAHLLEAITAAPAHGDPPA